ncbi:MAG: hypothetical protein AAFS10_13220 [Myxococcota bacterium]
MLVEFNLADDTETVLMDSTHRDFDWLDLIGDRVLVFTENI